MSVFDFKGEEQKIVPIIMSHMVRESGLTRLGWIEDFSFLIADYTRQTIYDEEQSEGVNALFERTLTDFFNEKYEEHRKTAFFILTRNVFVERCWDYAVGLGKWLEEHDRNMFSYYVYVRGDKRGLSDWHLIFEDEGLFPRKEYKDMVEGLPLDKVEGKKDYYKFSNLKFQHFLHHYDLVHKHNRDRWGVP